MLATACDAISRRSNGVVILYSVRLRCVERPASSAAALKVSQPRDANLDLSLAVMDVLCDMRRALSFVEIGAVDVESVAVGRAESLRKDLNRPAGWSRAGHVVQCEIVGKHGWRWTNFAKRVAGGGKWEQRVVKKKKAIGEMRKAVRMGERDTAKPSEVEAVAVKARGVRSVETTKTVDVEAVEEGKTVEVEAVEEGNTLEEEANAVDTLMEEVGIETVSDSASFPQRLQAETAAADDVGMSAAEDDETESDIGAPVQGLSGAAKMSSPTDPVVRSELHMGQGAAQDAEQGSPLAESKSGPQTFVAPAAPIASITERDQTPVELTDAGSLADKAPVAGMKHMRAKVKLVHHYGPDSEWRNNAYHQLVDSEASRPKHAGCVLADDIRAATSGGDAAAVSRGPSKPVLGGPSITPHAQVKRLERIFVALRKSSDARVPLMLSRLGRNLAVLQVEIRGKARERRRIADEARKCVRATRSASKRGKAAGTVSGPGKRVQGNQKRKASVLGMKQSTPSASGKKKKRNGFNDSATDTGNDDWGRKSRGTGTSFASSRIEVKKEDVEVDGYSISGSDRFDRSVDSGDSEQSGGLDMEGDEDEEDEDDDE